MASKLKWIQYIKATCKIGERMYSPVCGCCYLKKISDKIITVEYGFRQEMYFNENGQYIITKPLYADGPLHECTSGAILIFPDQYGNMVFAENGKSMIDMKITENYNSQINKKNS